ncbi:MAG: Gfo/Idh/MocA family oxidoreductase [Spirochaetales bacterium]|nr:Gfo/Idh/MocA family oxidoreductase [Spirochaetales bacterium]
MKQIRWGVLGYARIARTCLIPAMRQHEASILYALATRMEQAAEEARRESGFEKVYSSYDELLDDPLVDVVYIPLPNALHKEWAIKAMKKGKNVLCEKPLAMSGRDAREITAVAKECNVFFMEAFMYRFLDKMAKLKQLLDDKVIGDVRMIKSSWRFFLNRVNTIKEKPGLGGGCLYDVGCYPVSLVNLIMGKAPVEIRSLRNINEHGVDNSICAILKYDDGCMAQIDAGFDSISSKSTEISGTKGTILMPETYVDEERPIMVYLSDGTVRKICPEVQNRYLEEVKAVSEAVLSGKKELLSFDWTILNADVLERIMESD